MINQNLLRLKLVGRSGNADPHYVKDWIEIEVDTNLDTFDSSKAEDSDFEGKDFCDFPSVRIVEVFFERINTKNEP